MAPPQGSALEAAPPQAIGIVGGHGGIGSLFARLLGEAGLRVLVSDRATTLRNVDVAAGCDLTLVAVPLGVTPAVLAEMAPYVQSGAALASLGSLMELAMPALAPCDGESFLLHPLFGPGRKRLRRATLAYASLRDGPRQNWLVRWLRKQGASVVVTTPQEHDRLMAVAQALLHGSYAALAPEITRGLPADNLLAWASPTLRLQLGLMSRILHQNPHLYGDLLARNRHAPAAIDALIGRLAALRLAAEDGPDAVATFFAAAREALGSYGPPLAAEGARALDEE
jgi:prephenate dehydrogenase